MIDWKHPTPFLQELTVNEEDIDFLNHVNNKVYLQWMEQIAWQHSLSVGIDHDLQQKEGKIMVVKQHQLNYHASCVLNDELIIGTWLGERIGCCQRKRFYEIYRKQDAQKVFSAHTVWVCMDLATHRACKIPQAFIQAYEIPKTNELP